MPPKEKTLIDQTETLGNQTEYDAVMERLRSIQNYVTRVLGNQADDHRRLEEMAAQLEVQARQLDHLDGMVHEIHQFIAEHKPALNKALALMDPGTSVRKYFKSRKGDAPDGG
jgi:DNA repair ATPase RecN